MISKNKQASGQINKKILQCQTLRTKIKSNPMCKKQSEKLSDAIVTLVTLKKISDNVVSTGSSGFSPKMCEKHMARISDIMESIKTLEKQCKPFTKAL